MQTTTFRKINNLTGWLVFAVSALVYLLTIEPTVSFWDCGEFIASSYKLEIGHPPGNPTFQLIARLFTLFADKQHAAMMINIMSALCSALTVMFLFWTLTHLCRRLVEMRKQTWDAGKTVAVIGAGLTGALTYAFSDTFWFSAVEAEVYAMSSLFTAMVFWAMLKWEECSDETCANRWIVLIAYLIGLSIGVHLLSLLAIPAMVFVYYYKKHTFSWKGALLSLLLSGVMILAVMHGVVRWLPLIASKFDYLFVNSFHLPFNSGMLFFLVLLFVLCFWGIFFTYRKGKVVWNTILLCFTVMVIGYTSFAMVVIRSSAKTPTNENQPDNPFSLYRYLAREQYGSAPLIYGETYRATPIDWKSPDYITPMGDRYVRSKGMDEYVYKDSDKMLFPRMHSHSESHKAFYDSYIKGSGKPSFFENLSFFFDYQIGYMYFRYFMWNFVGRQNDYHGTNPGDPIRGNWESGIKFIDKARLGDQSKAPEAVKNNKAKNHFYFLPLLLGLTGLFYQCRHDRRYAWIIFLLFFLTGLAEIIYLNQPPYQPRERDYALAASFYAFAIWVGMGVMAIEQALRKKMSAKIAGTLAALLGIVVPVQMLSQTWDDHDRSGRFTAQQMAKNYLNSCAPGAILITHGDNDTFPLWYIQEVEDVRTDVRIMNSSLMGVDWYIDQMQYKMYESEPVSYVMPKELYLYGTNDMVPIYDKVNQPVSLARAVRFMANPKNQMTYDENTRLTYLPARRLRMKVNKENALRYGIVEADKASLIPEYIDFEIPANKNSLSKFELMTLDLLSTYQWDRPLYIVNNTGDLNIGIKSHWQPDGMIYRFVPYEVDTGQTQIMDTDRLYNQLMEVYQWKSMNDPDIYVDYQNIYTFGVVSSVREMYSTVAKNLGLEGKKEKMTALLDKVQEIMPRHNFPLNFSIVPSYNEYAVIEMIELYFYGDQAEKALALASDFLQETVEYLAYFTQIFPGKYYPKREIEICASYYYQTLNIMKAYGKEEEAGKWEALLDRYLSNFL